MHTITFRQQLEIRYQSAVRQGFFHTACALKEIIATVPTELHINEKHPAEITPSTELCKPCDHDIALLQSASD